METKTTTPESPAETLARSFFGFALLAFIPALLTWIAFFFAPVAAESVFGQIRTLIVIGFGVIVLLLFALCAWTLRASPENLLNLSRKIAALLTKAWLVIPLLLILLEANFFVALALYSVAPAFVEPARFLLGAWSLLVLLVVITMNRYALAAWLDKTRTTWTFIGVTILLLALAGGMSLITQRLIRAGALDDRIRGGLDSSALPFIDDGNMPTTGLFMAEQAQRRVEWLPYAYWTVEEMHGQYITVGADGLRHTPNFAPDDARQIFFFGGSTMWGEGARDAYTIPGQVAALLNEANTPQRVTNFGQTGYVSTQDLLLFQMQLLNGHTPDAAVFYQGFNDILSAYTQGVTGLPLQENQRVSDVEAGRLLRGGQPVLRLPAGELNPRTLPLVAKSGNTAAAIVERWLANVKMTQTLAQAYGVQAIVIWQPAIIFKASLTDSEQAIVARMESEYPGMTALYTEADTLVREAAQNENSGIVILSDLFENDDRPIFYDLVHITEAGNRTVSEALLPQLEAALAEN